MAKKKKAAKIIVNIINLTPVSRVASVSIDRDLRVHVEQMRAALNQLESVLQASDDEMKGLEAQDKLGNFAIQELMSTLNQLATLASSVAKKADEIISCSISKM